MNDTQSLTLQAPKTGPWIVAYVLWLVGGGVLGGQLGLTATPAMPALFWGGLFCIVGMIIFTSWRRHRLLGTLSVASRKFWPRIVLSAAVMFGGFCLVAFLQYRMEDSFGQGARLLLLLPALGIAAMVWSIHQYVRDEEDEFLRSQAIRQQLIASWMTMVICALWGGLNSSGLVSYAGTFSEAVLIWFAALGIGRLVNELRP